MQDLLKTRYIEELSFPANGLGLDALHAMLERFWLICDESPIPLPTGAWRYAFVTATCEISGNIVRHAYASTPHGQITLRLRLYHNRVEARFTDTGKPYTPSPIAALFEDDDDELLFAESGRGLQIASIALDRLHYRRTPSGINIWRLIKYIP